MSTRWGMNGALVWAVLAAGALGYLLGQRDSGATAGAAPAVAGGSPAATATRAAELSEVASLQTRVALLATLQVCIPPSPTPSPSPSPSPTPVPPLAAGQPVSYTGDWAVTVSNVALVPNVRTIQARGVFALVAMTVNNGGTDARPFPYADLRLRDSAGRVFTPQPGTSVLAGTPWLNLVSPGIPVAATIVFDIATDATGPFILESVTDPFFRVQVRQQRLG